MANRVHRRVVLARRPLSTITADVFAIDEAPIPEIREGEVLVRNEYLSIEPGTANAMRASERSAVPSIGVGEVIHGLSVGRVVASRAPGFAEGDVVRGGGGWQEYSVLSASPTPRNLTDTRKIDGSRAPLPAWLGVLGISGLSAWLGVTAIARPSSGETFVVSAGSGAVGALAGQYAKLAGARVVGIVGGAAKCAYVKGELGFDAAVDHRASLIEGLDAACPDGVDAYFENVGGRVLEAVWPRMNARGRIALCGLVAQYGMESPPPGPNLFDAIIKGLTLTGFIGVAPEHAHLVDRFEEETTSLLAAQKIKHREDIVVGIERAGEAYVDLLKGANLGKRLLAVG